ncbi:MAG: hypothetical protein LKJ94_05960 [Candidatus Methanomethylophilus sp.]|nr:hypothetical protein [Methanomethylophilus sp.]MCI2075223.1 hypothetical protein [Methanomethylophilus sp.]MCI2092565.1 hypothetical protein [Methanomethylophilus sp.]
MAKKRHLVKEQQEEEYSFTPSDFDEKEFILKSIYTSKVLLITIVFAVIVGVIASFICKALDDTVATVICTAIVFAFVAVMKKLYRVMGIRVDLMDGKSLAGDYLIFLILALGVCIVFINAPFD